MSPKWQHIDVAAAAALLADRKADCIDIRDPQSFAAGHIPAATHLTNQNVGEYLARTARNRPVIVCCYHGNSSQGAAQFFIEQGFSEVYSLDGGFDVWRFNHPVER